jgi:hypothetical protein
MPETAFLDKSKKPTDKALALALGDIADLWYDLIAFMHENHSPIVEEWKFMKSGWTLVPKRKARTVCYLFPAQNYFTVAFTLGEKAVEVARQSKLPKKILDSIEEARPYAEGRGFYVKATKPADLKHLQALVTIKMEN